MYPLWTVSRLHDIAVGHQARDQLELQPESRQKYCPGMCLRFVRVPWCLNLHPQSLLLHLSRAHTGLPVFIGSSTNSFQDQRIVKSVKFSRGHPGSFG